MNPNLNQESETTLRNDLSENFFEHCPKKGRGRPRPNFFGTKWSFGLFLQKKACQVAPIGGKGRGRRGSLGNPWKKTSFFLGEAMSIRDSLCHNLKQILKVGLHTKRKSKLHFFYKSFSGIMWRYMLFRSSLIELGRNGFFDLNICLLSIEHISSLRSCWEKFEKTPGWLTDGFVFFVVITFFFSADVALFFLGLSSDFCGREDKLNLDSIKIKMVTDHRILCARILSLYVLQYEIIQ